MAIAYGAVVGEVHTTGTGSTSALVTSATVPSGAKIILGVHYYATAAMSSMAGGALTWQIDHDQLGTSNYRAAVVSADAPAGLASGTTLTATFGAVADTKRVGGIYVTGLGTGVGSVDVHNGAGAASGGTATANLVTTNADDFLFQTMWVDFLGAGDVTPAASMIEVYDVTHADGQKDENAYRIVAATSTYAIGGTFTTNPWVLAGVAYKADTGGAAAATPGRRRRVHPARDSRFGRLAGPTRSFYRHNRGTAAGSTDFDGTATPAAIDVAVAMPQAVLQAGATATPVAVPLAAVLPQAGLTGGTGATATPAAIVAGPVVMPQAVLQAGSAATPAAIVAGPVVMPQAVLTVGALVTPAVLPLAVTFPGVTTQGGSTVTPAATSLTLTLPAAVTAAGSTAAPAVIPLAVTLPAAAATGGGSATALPAATTLNVALPQAVLAAGAVVSPAATVLSVTMPAAVTKGGATVSPAVLPLTLTIPAATATGASPGTATPASITTSVTMPQATPLAGSTVTPAATVLTVTMPAALAQASKTTTPAVIPLTVTMPAATASGSTASVATPNAIALVTVLPSPTLQYGYVVNPNVIALAISIGAAIASGLQPDAHPVTITLRDAGHTVTVRVVGTTATIRDSGHTATARVASTSDTISGDHSDTVREQH